MARRQSVILTPSELKTALAVTKETIKTQKAVSSASEKEAVAASRAIRKNSTILAKAAEKVLKAEIALRKAREELDYLNSLIPKKDAACATQPLSDLPDLPEAEKTPLPNSPSPCEGATSTPSPTPSEECSERSAST